MIAETQTGSAFQFQLPVFEGPLDLLLHLIEREELDVTVVSLVQVADQYLAYLHDAERVDATALAEFIAIGARLVLLKSRALLPKPPADDEVEEDFGDDLVRRLREYKRFKEVAGALRDLEERGLRAHPRVAPPLGLPLPTGLDGVTLDLLADIVREVLERTPEEEPEEIVHRHEVTVEDKVKELSLALKAQGRLSFRAFISECRSKVAIIVSFMAVLELIKGLQLVAEQDAQFGDINLIALEVEGAA